MTPKSIQHPCFFGILKDEYLLRIYSCKGRGYTAEETYIFQP